MCSGEFVKLDDEKIGVSCGNWAGAAYNWCFVNLKHCPDPHLFAMGREWGLSEDLFWEKCTSSGGRAFDGPPGSMTEEEIHGREVLWGVSTFNLWIALVLIITALAAPVFVSLLVRQRLRSYVLNRNPDDEKKKHWIFQDISSKDIEQLHELSNPLGWLVSVSILYIALRPLQLPPLWYHRFMFLLSSRHILQAGERCTFSSQFTLPSSPIRSLFRLLSFSLAPLSLLSPLSLSSLLSPSSPHPSKSALSYVW